MARIAIVRPDGSPSPYFWKDEKDGKSSSHGWASVGAGCRGILWAGAAANCKRPVHAARERRSRMIASIRSLSSA